MNHPLYICTMCEMEAVQIGGDMCEACTEALNDAAEGKFREDEIADQAEWEEYIQSHSPRGRQLKEDAQIARDVVLATAYADVMTSIRIGELCALTQ